MSFAFGFKNYKCFGDEIVWLDWSPITVLIGKNNSGKSSVIEIIKKIVGSDGSFTEEKWHRTNEGRNAPEIFIKQSLTEQHLTSAFRDGTSGGPIQGYHASYRKSYIGSKATFRLINTNQVELLEVEQKNEQHKPFLMNLEGDYKQRVTNSLQSPLKHTILHWIIPERQIKPEGKNDTPGINGSGAGLTNAIQTFLNHRSFPESIIEKNLLDGLNEIFLPDYKFTKITTQHSQDSYEVFIEESGRKIPLSDCGTGIKTIFLILSMILLVPVIEKNDLSKYVFAFEELENNLHPQLLRRLLTYITRECREKKFKVILTTHSNVTIDFYSTVDESQIYHIKNIQGNARVNKVKTFFDNKNVLVDLDVRASDLLQANGIIWVEGPSDRILLNKWIHAWSAQQLHEGTHYQILFYGGRLLSHLTANEESNELIKMLNVNTNSAILIDSDKRKRNEKINLTKQRLLDEFERFLGFSWLTKGREIENYYPQAVVEKIIKVKPIEQYNNFNSFFDVMEKSSKGLGTKLANQKPKLASDILENFDIDQWRNSLDLNKQMNKLIAEIKKWNNL